MYRLCPEAQTLHPLCDGSAIYVLWFTSLWGRSFPSVRRLAFSSSSTTRSVDWVCGGARWRRLCRLLWVIFLVRYRLVGWFLISEEMLPLGYHLKNIYIFIYFNQRIITLQYCNGLCQTLTWIGHRQILFKVVLRQWFELWNWLLGEGRWAKGRVWGHGWSMDSGVGPPKVGDIYCSLDVTDLKFGWSFMVSDRWGRGASWLVTVGGRELRRASWVRREREKRRSLVGSAESGKKDGQWLDVLNVWAAREILNQLEEAARRQTNHRVARAQGAVFVLRGRWKFSRSRVHVGGAWSWRSVTAFSGFKNLLSIFSFGTELTGKIWKEIYC